MFTALQARYKRGELQKELSMEGPWLQEVRQNLIEKSEKEHPIVKFRLKALVEHSIDPVLRAYAKKASPD